MLQEADTEVVRVEMKLQISPISDNRPQWELA
jgi:hypothetical protein